MIEIIDVGGSPESKVDSDKKEDKLENGTNEYCITFSILTWMT